MFDTQCCKQQVLRKTRSILANDSHALYSMFDTQCCKQQVLRKTRSILANDSHALYPMFDTLQSGRRFRCLSCKTNRKKLSFIPAVFSTM